jgi:hypothetical protein
MSDIPLNWIPWFILFFFTATWSLQWYRIMSKPGGSLTFGTMNTIIIWWLLLAWTFHYSSVNKLHLLWLAPTAIPVATWISIKTVMDSMGEGKHRQLPAGIWKLIAIYVGVLLFLTS